MATLTGNDGAVYIGATAVAAVRNFSVEQTADTIETTHMATSGGARTYLKGLSSWSGSADIYFDSADLSIASLTPTGGAVGDGTVAVKFFVDQDATNDIVFYGACIITGFTVNSSMDGMVEASISFQGSSPATFSASGNVVPA